MSEKQSFDVYKDKAGISNKSTLQRPYEFYDFK